jgi:hypothetical protein
MPGSGFPELLFYIRETFSRPGAPKIRFKYLSLQIIIMHSGNMMMTRKNKNNN